MSEYVAEPIDKTQWGPGPWQTEPDRFEWRHAGRPCLMVRHPRSGHWCGYAAVDPGHPLHGKDYSDGGVDLDVHGGLTYASECSGSVCHVAKLGEPDEVWWFGFDCAHAWDLRPEETSERSLKTQREVAEDCARHYGGPVSKWLDLHKDEIYRDFAYVKAETENLADQLVAAAVSSPDRTTNTQAADRE